MDEMTRLENAWTALHDWASDIRKNRGLTVDQFVRGIGFPEDHGFVLYPIHRQTWSGYKIYNQLSEAKERYDSKLIVFEETTDEERAKDWCNINYGNFHDIQHITIEISEDGVLEALCYMGEGATVPDIPYVKRVIIQRTLPL